MDCPHCQSTRVSPLQRKTSLGYDMFRCKSCRRTSMSARSHLSILSKSPQILSSKCCSAASAISLAIGMWLRFFLLRGFQFTHETVRFWEERFLPYFTDQIRTKRKGKVGKVWLVDETYVRVKGAWCYLYRGIDENGNLVDVRLSKTRDMAGTKAFFAQAIGLHEESPEKVATDGSGLLSTGDHRRTGPKHPARGAPLHRQPG